MKHQVSEREREVHEIFTRDMVMQILLYVPQSPTLVNNIHEMWSRASSRCMYNSSDPSCVHYAYFLACLCDPHTPGQKGEGCASSHDSL